MGRRQRLQSCAIRPSENIPDDSFQWWATPHRNLATGRIDRFRHAAAPALHDFSVHGGVTEPEPSGQASSRSVFEKSSPVQRRLCRESRTTANVMQSPKFKAALCLPFPNRTYASTASDQCRSPNAITLTRQSCRNWISKFILVKLV